MSIVIDRSNLNRAVDYTDLLVDAPVVDTLLDALGLFEDVYSTQKTVQIRNIDSSTHIVTDRNWDERSNTIVTRPERREVNVKIPHLPAQDAITPNDIDGVFSDNVNTLDGILTLASVAEVRAQKMAGLVDAHALTKTAARYQLLKEGTVYAPNGTLRTSYGNTVNWYTEFGVTRQSIAIDFAGTTDPRIAFRGLQTTVVNTLRRRVGAVANSLVVLCGSEFFTALMTNAYVTDAYKYVPGATSLQVLLGTLPAAANLSAMYQTLNVFGFTFIDVGQAGYEGPDGTFVQFVADDEALLIPRGVRGMFKTYYAPANRFSSINKQSQGSYWFETANDKHILIETEQNMMNACTMPEAIFTLTMA